MTHLFVLFRHTQTKSLVGASEEVFEGRIASLIALSAPRLVRCGEFGHATIIKVYYSIEEEVKNNSKEEQENEEQGCGRCGDKQTLTLLITILSFSARYVVCHFNTSAGVFEHSLRHN